MYNAPYINAYNPQIVKDRIDSQIAQLQQMKEQLNQPMQQPTNLTQNFQLAPNTNYTMKFANTIDDVIKENVYVDTPFFSKDMTIMWIKNAKGDIKTYELNEIVPKDEKDMQIELLQNQINELKGMINNVSNDTNVNAKQDTANTTINDEPIREEFKNEKSTSISKVSRGKKE